jgi:pimeloyl-ACP methyl ester carboxylesterase
MPDSDAAHASLAPVEKIARVESLGRRVTTPCGAGEMVWRIWGAGPPLVLLHGNFGSWLHWIRNVEALSRHYTVMVPDTPGFGESALPHACDTPQAVGGVVADGIVHIVPPDEQVVVVGFSYGGRLSGEVAVILGDRLSTLVVVAPGGLGIDDSAKSGIAKLRPRMTAAEIADVHRQNLAMLMIADPDKVDDLAVHIQDVNTRRSRIRLTSWTVEDRQSSLARVLPRVQAPVKGIWADRDAFAGETLQNRLDLVARLRPEADIRMLSGAGHWMQYEVADRFNALLLEMLGPPPT